MTAIGDAMSCCRPDWSEDFRCWLKFLIQLNFDSALLKNNGQWYEVVNGVPTVGINSVDCGNIAFFFRIEKPLYIPKNQRVYVI